MLTMIHLIMTLMDCEVEITRQELSCDSFNCASVELGDFVNDIKREEDKL